MMLYIKRLQLLITKFFKGFKTNTVNRDLRILGVLGFIVLFLLLLALFGNYNSKRETTFKETDNYKVVYVGTSGKYVVTLDADETTDVEAILNQIEEDLADVDPNDIIYDIPAAWVGKTKEYIEFEEQYDVNYEAELEDDLTNYETLQDYYQNGPPGDDIDNL